MREEEGSEREEGMKVREERMIETNGGSDSSPTVRLGGGTSDRVCVCVCVCV